MDRAIQKGRCALQLKSMACPHARSGNPKANPQPHELKRDVHGRQEAPGTHGLGHGMGLARAAGGAPPERCSEGSGSQRCAPPLWEIEASWGRQLPRVNLGKVSRHPACELHAGTHGSCSRLLNCCRPGGSSPCGSRGRGCCRALPSVRWLMGPGLPTRGGSSPCPCAQPAQAPHTPAG